MKKIILIIMVAMSSGMATFSANLSDGYYRAMNFKTGHYLFVRDCTGHAASTADQDVNAIELWAYNDSILSDPGAIVYVNKIGSNYDVIAQNTGIHAMTGHYFGIWEADNTGTNWMIEFINYLYDIGSNPNSPGSVYTGDRTYVRALTSSDMPNMGEYRVWTLKPVSASTDNYFGFAPTTTAKEKHYAPFLAAFAYTPADGMKTWYVYKIDKTAGEAYISEVSGTVAASQPVIVECPGTTIAENKVELTSGGATYSTNLMDGTYFCNGERSNMTHTGDPAIVPFDANTMRVLGTDAEGNLAFVKDITGNPNVITMSYYDSTGAQVTGPCIRHNTSYLTVDADCPAILKVVEGVDPVQPSGISGVPYTQKTSSDIYTVSGVKVNQMQKNQLYIVDGKKIINK